ncbi:MAG: hypothetical protein AAGH89_19145, partial [Verrucomicrobiota bacterium]
ARDYILEENWHFHVRDWKCPTGGVKIDGQLRKQPTLRILSMLERETTMTPYYAFPKREEGINAVARSETGENHHVVINGNQSGYDPNPPPPLPTGATKPMTNLCHGRIIVDGKILKPPSDDRITPPGDPRFGSNLAGPLGNYLGQTNEGSFVFHGGIVPETSDLRSAMGGLSTNYKLRDGMFYSQAVGKVNSVTGESMIFTATHLDGFGGMTALRDAAIRSGLRESLDGEDPSLGGRGCELLILDGNDATALLYRSPNHEWTGRWHGLHQVNGVSEYFVSTYLMFECRLPRK